MNKKAVILCLAIALIFFISIKSTKDDSVENANLVSIGNRELIVDIADTPEERTLGLSGRENLAENEAMLFIFENIARHGIWMKDMNFAIDIIWLDENKNVIYIKEDARPENFPEVYSPELPAKYVLEVVSGFVAESGLGIGDKAEFTF